MAFRFYIRITCPCDLYPLTPHFYIVKLGCTGVYFCLTFALKHRLWGLVRTASMRRFERVPTTNVLSKNKKNITIFNLKIIFFTAVKNCIILHGRVFVMNGNKSFDPITFNKIMQSFPTPVMRPISVIKIGRDIQV